MSDYKVRGVRFRYPDSWSLVDESSDEKVAVTVQSDGTAFWTVAVFDDGPDPERVLESAVAAFREDYPEVDVYPVETHTGPHGPVISRDVEFVCLELLAGAHIDVYQSGGRTVLVLSQAADVDFESVRPVLDAMTASLDVD